MIDDAEARCCTMYIYTHRADSFYFHVYSISIHPLRTSVRAVLNLLCKPCAHVYFRSPRTHLPASVRRRGNNSDCRAGSPAEPSEPTPAGTAPGQGSSERHPVSDNPTQRRQYRSVQAIVYLVRKNPEPLQRTSLADRDRPLLPPSSPFSPPPPALPCSPEKPHPCTAARYNAAPHPRQSPRAGRPARSPTPQSLSTFWRNDV